MNYDVYRPQIETLIANQQFRDYEMPANSDTTFWTDLGYTARRPFRDARDYRNWIGQMRDIPRYFREQMDEMRRGLKRGFTPPQVTMKGRDASITAVTEASPEQSLFYTPFKEMPGIAERGPSLARAQAVAVIRDSVQPAYRDLLAFMRNEYLPGMRIKPRRLMIFPTARRITARRSASTPPSTWTPTPSTPWGNRRSRACTARWSTPCTQTGFKGDFPAFLVFLRADAAVPGLLRRRIC